MAGSEISFFQRYSQQENHVTNNTALLLKHIYQTSPLKLQNVLRQIVDSDFVCVGPTFVQQQRSKRSTPDASIAQPGWQNIIETKLTPHLDEDQIHRHFDGVHKRPGEPVCVIGLTTAMGDQASLSRLTDAAGRAGIIFSWRTFSELAEIVAGVPEPHETALREIIADYINFLHAAGVIDAPDDRIYVVPCGTSYEDNLRFGLYYHGAERPYRRAKYLGIYRRRCVSLIGEVSAIAICNYRGGKLEAQAEYGTLTEDHRQRIVDVIEATTYYDIKTGHRFFVTEGFAKTAINKATSGGIMGPRYLSISQLLQSKMSPSARLEEVAQALQTTTFE
jgi:hypothetical protein